MSERIYVTVADTKHMDTRVVYAGMDKSEAFDVLDEHTQTSVSLTRGEYKLHAFVQVWEDGEHQFDTRDPSVVADG